MNFRDAVTIVYRGVRPLGTHTLHLSCGDATNVVVFEGDTTNIVVTETVYQGSSLRDAFAAVEQRIAEVLATASSEEQARDWAWDYAVRVETEVEA